MEIVNAQRGLNPFARYAGRWVLRYWDPSFRLHFCFWDETHQRIPTFRSRGEADRAMHYHAVSRDFWAIYRPYRPELIQYEANKEFDDYYHQMHYELDIPVIWFGSVAEMDEMAAGRRVFTPGAVPTMSSILAVGS